jgi:hypothetical protein
VDQFSLTGSATMAGKTMSMSASCELMHNQLPGSPVQPNTDIAVVQDHTGNPMLFTIGSDKKFRLIRTSAGSPTGFEEIDLCVGFEPSAGAAGFDVSEDAGGRITVVVAMLRGEGPATDVYVAAMLSNDPAQTDWTRFHALAQPLSGIDTGFAGQRVRMGTSDDGAAPYITVVGALGGQQVFYQLLDHSKPATRLEFPENVPADQNAVLDMTIGYAFGQRGVWYLYNNGASETLECTTLADADQGAMTYDFSPGYGTIPAALRYNCVATPTGSDTDAFSISSDVYVGTDQGIYLFQGAHAAAPRCVTDQLKDVHQIVVRQDAQCITLWVMCSPSRLYYIYGKKGANYTWNTPILFSQSVLHMAPLRVRTRSASEVFVVNTDLSVTHHWQDPASTLWQNCLIKAPGSSYLLNVPTFTSHICLLDPDGFPLSGVPIGITASEWTWVTINGLVYSLDHDTPATVLTDTNGSVTMIGLAADIAPPIFHLVSDQFAEIVNLYPNGKILAGLQLLGSGADLRNARTASGAPVVAPEMSSDTLDGVASNLATLTGVVGASITGTRPVGTRFVSLDTAKHSGLLATAHLPAGFVIGMQLRAGVWQAHPAPAAHAAMALGGVLDDIETWAGDALHWLETAFSDGIKQIEQGVTYLSDGVSFVIQKVEQGLMFVLDMAGKVFKIVLKTLGAVLKALNWVLKLVGIDLAKILAWLGLLFGWDDIWKTHKILASVIRSGLDSSAQAGADRIAAWRADIKAELAGVPDALRKLVLPASVAALSVKRQTAASDIAAPSAGRTAQGSFSHYQIAHGGMLNDAGGNAPAAGLASFSDFLNTVVEPAINGVLDDLGKLANDVYQLFQDPAKTVQHLATLLCDAVDMVIDLIGTIVDGALAFAQDVIATLSALLRDRIDIPFLSDFYSFLTDLLGDEEDLTVINAVALLVAIPVVEICRIAGVKPFDGAEALMSDPQLMARVTGTAAPQARSRALMSAAPGVPAASPALADVAGAQAGLNDSASAQYTAWGSVLGGFSGVLGAGCTLLLLNNADDAILRRFRVRTVATGFSLARYALTFPIKSTGCKTAAWTIGTVFTIADYFVPWAKVRGGMTIVRGLSGLILSLIEDGEANPQPHFLVYTADITSNIGAVAIGTNMIKSNMYSTAGGAAQTLIGAVASLSYGVVRDAHDHAISNAGG